MGIDNLYLFIAAGLLLNLTPGPDVLYIVANGVRALIAASATAFTALKWLGAAYLLYLGMTKLWLEKYCVIVKTIANYLYRTWANSIFTSKNEAEGSPAAVSAVAHSLWCERQRQPDRT